MTNPDTQDAERDTLVKLRGMVSQIVGGKEVIAFAHAWANDQASYWPHGTYSKYDLAVMYEAGFYRGYMRGAADTADRNDP